MGDVFFTRKYIKKNILIPTINFINKGPGSIQFTLINNHTKTVEVYWEVGNSNPLINFVSLNPNETSGTIEATGLIPNTTNTIFAVSRIGNNKSEAATLTQTTLNVVQGLRVLAFNVSSNFSSPLNTSQFDNFFTAGSGKSLITSTQVYTGTPINWAQASTNGAGGLTGPKPNYLPNDYFSWQASGFLLATETGSYQFGVDGDDAVELFVNGINVANYYGAHGFNGNWTGGAVSPGQFSGSINLTAGVYYTIRARMEERAGGDGMQAGWKTPSAGSIVLIPANRLFRTP